MLICEFVCFNVYVAMNGFWLRWVGYAFVLADFRVFAFVGFGL